MSIVWIHFTKHINMEGGMCVCEMEFKDMSIVWFFLKETSQKYCTMYVLRHLVLKIHFTIKWGNIFICHEDTYGVVKYTNDNSQQGSVVVKWSWIHNTYCNKLLIHNSRAGITAWHDSESNVFRWFEQCLHDIESVTPMTHMNSGYHWL
jgi:hypothetical protein